MRALAFWKTVTVDKANLLEQIVTLLDERRIRYCVVAGQAVNAYVEPLVSLDLDLAVAIEDISRLASLLTGDFRVEQFPHSLNVSLPGSDLRVQFQTDRRYARFLERSSPREILGRLLPVAAIEDVLQGEVWAAQDLTQRQSNLQKDLTDIARLLEGYPHLREQVPPDVLEHLV